LLVIWKENLIFVENKIAIMTKLAYPLNTAQLEILKLFSHPMNDKDLSALKETLIDFLMQKLVASADRSVAEQGLTTEEVNNWRFEHNRASPNKL
jgi:hypothetical protein